MPIYKGFDERMTTEVRRRFAWGYGHAAWLNQNVDGECVRIAGERLLRQPQERRVLMVWSDGQPACLAPDSRALYSDLHASVAWCERAGIEVIGVGIQTDVVKRFYPKHFVLDDVADLPRPPGPVSGPWIPARRSAPG